MNAHKDTAGPMVLLIENEPVVRTGVAACLTEAGFSVIETASATEAWTALEMQPNVRVLFTDLDTANQADGLELARRVHDRWPSIGLVMVSGNIRHLRPTDIPGNGCFLPRPLPTETLLHEIRLAAHPIAT